MPLPFNLFYFFLQIEDFSSALPPWARKTKTCSWDKRGLTSFPVSFDFIFSDGICEDPGRYVCCHNIDVRLYKDFHLSSFSTSDLSPAMASTLSPPRLSYFDNHHSHHLIIHIIDFLPGPLRTRRCSQNRNRLQNSLS